MAKRFRQHKPTVRDGAVALCDHVRAIAGAAREKYGPVIDLAAMHCILEDRRIVRYPVSLVFDDSALEDGEFAHPHPNGCAPRDVFTIFIHPFFQERPDDLPLLMAYPLVRVNYGDVASQEEAEVFGAALLGMDQDAYYDAVCRLADAIPARVGG